ncbi:11572_t:CDS:2 [Funneliformis geosporum]|uniref:11572_t:CDS:1 n=1 Tax=Funneliformis geosporum TaxID=1117311 RepID=A0A9W4SK17_9GLOM|nr:11572_t:CDS:2 [Funneliformis geosporum]
MTVDLTEPITPLTQYLEKRKPLYIELFTKDLFEKKIFHKIMKMQKLIMKFGVLIVCKKKKIWLHKIDSNTINLWRHIKVHHLEKDLRPNKKAKKSVAEDQNTLDKFIGQIKIPFKASIIK